MRKGSHRRAERAKWSTGGVCFLFLNGFVDGLESSKVESFEVGLNYLTWSP